MSLLSAVRHRVSREDASDKLASSPSSPDGPLAADAPIQRPVSVSGAALLSITYWLFANFAISPPKPGPGSPASALKVATALAHQRSIGLHRLKVWSGIALAIMFVV